MTHNMTHHNESLIIQELKLFGTVSYDMFNEDEAVWTNDDFTLKRMYGDAYWALHHKLTDETVCFISHG